MNKSITRKNFPILRHATVPIADLHCAGISVYRPHKLKNEIVFQVFKLKLHCTVLKSVCSEVNNKIINLPNYTLK